MAKYISAEELRKLQQSLFAREAGRERELRLLTILIDECKELNTEEAAIAYINKLKELDKC